MQKILITGGSGFIGRHLVQKLSSFSDTTLVLLTRDAEALQQILKHVTNKPKIVQGDLSEFESLIELSSIEGIDIVIHLAAEVSSFGPKENYYNTNVDGTRNLLRIISGWEKRPFFVFSSSIAVYGFTDRQDIKEDIVLKKCGWPYADSKIEAEKLIQDFSHSHLMKGIILRVGDVLGVGSVWVDGVIKQIESGKIVLPKDNNGNLNYIWIDDLLSVIISLIGKKNGSFIETYNVSGGKNINFNKYFSKLTFIDQGHRIMELPFYLLIFVSSINSFFCTLFKIETEFTPYIIKYIFSAKTVSIAKLLNVINGDIKFADFKQIFVKIEQQYYK